jgi:hypothetical protein
MGSADMDAQKQLAIHIDTIHIWYQEWFKSNGKDERKWRRIGDFRMRTRYASSMFQSSSLLVEIAYVGSGSRFLTGDPVVRIPERIPMDELLRRQHEHTLYLVENEFRVEQLCEHLGSPDSLPEGTRPKEAWYE